MSWIFCFYFAPKQFTNNSTMTKFSSVWVNNLTSLMRSNFHPQLSSFTKLGPFCYVSIKNRTIHQTSFWKNHHMKWIMKNYWHTWFYSTIPMNLSTFSTTDQLERGRPYYQNRIVGTIAMLSTITCNLKAVSDLIAAL